MKRFPKLSRRAFLGGAGALIALPMLESALPKVARAEGSVARRVVCFYVPNGIYMPAFTPAAKGAGFELTPMLAPLKGVREKLLVVTGLNNWPGIPDDGAGDHASGTSSFLTCAHAKKTEGADIRLGISMDQVAANHIGKSTRIKSMQLGIDGGAGAGGCDVGYSCAYSRNISWASATQPLAKTVNPQVVFDQLFDGFDPNASAAEKARRRRYQASVLDYALDDAKRLAGKLAHTDGLKLEEYMDGVRDLEKKIALAVGPGCNSMDKPPQLLEYPEHVKMMCDLMVLALQCDATRVISFMLGNGGSSRAYPFLGVSETHHECSHHQFKQENYDKLIKIGTWEVAQLAYLLQALDAIPEGEGTLLDACAVYFASECEDGNSHKHENIPILLAGGCGGAFATGRHLVYEDKPPVANLFASILNAVGVDVATFGENGTGPLPQILA